MRQKADEVS